MAWFAFAGVLVVAFLFVMWRGRGNTFVYDEWGWIEDRRSGLGSIVDSYNDHLLVVPLAVYQLLFHTVGLAHYTIYRVLAAVAHLGCAAAVFEFARRRVGVLAVLLAAPVAVLGSGWEYVLEGVNFGFTASIALGIAAFLVLDRRDRAADPLACGLLVLGLACSELAAMFAVGVAVVWLISDRSVQRAWVWGIPLLLYGAWFAGYYHPGVSGSYDLTQVPKFVINMASSAAGGLFGENLQIGRAILLMVAGVVGWRIIRFRALSPVLVSLLVTVAAFWLVVALGRAQLGRPFESHYTYTAVVLIVLILAESLRGIHITRAVVAVGLGLALLAVIGNLRAFAGGEAYLHTSSVVVTAELGALQLAHAGAPASLVLDPSYAPQIQAGPYFAAVRALGSTPADTPSQLIRAPEPEKAAADNLLVRAGELQFIRPADVLAVASRGPVVTRASAGTVSRQPGCVTLRASASRATLELILPASGIAITAPTNAANSVQVRRFARTFPSPANVTLRGPRTTIIRSWRDSSPAPWQLQITTRQWIRACKLR